MYLSIVIPIRNEERYIIDTLDALINQDYPKQRYEILVVDGMSEDSTRVLVEKFSKEHSDNNIHLFDNPGRLSSRARNIGFRKAKGKLIGVIDGHVYIPNNQLFISMERLKEDNNAMCLARPQPLDVPGLRSGKPFWIAIARESWIGHSKNSNIFNKHVSGFIDPTSSGFAYDKSIFKRVGYVDEAFDAAEDVEFNYRVKQAGYKAYTSPNLLVYYYPRTSLWTLFKQQVRYGEGRARFARKHPDGLTKETPVPAFIFLLFILSPLTFIYSASLPQISIPYLAIIFLYWVILLCTGFFEAIKRKKLIQGIFIALGVWAIHMGLGWGFLKTVFLPANTLFKTTIETKN